jgi:hypothetical protein
MTTENSLAPRAWKQFNGTGGAVNALLFDVDTTMYTTGVLQLAGTFAASVQIEGSNDRVNWVALPTIAASVAVSNPSIAALTAVGTYLFNSPTQFVRARLTAWTSGLVAGVGGFSTCPPLFTTENVTLGAGSSLLGAVASSASATVGTATLSFNFRSAASTNVALILAGARKLYGYTFYNPSATLAFVKLYNVAIAPVVATDIPLLIIPVPAGAERVYINPQGKGGFAAGLGIACTGLIANTDATATTVDQIVGHIDYI